MEICTRSKRKKIYFGGKYGFLRKRWFCRIRGVGIWIGAKFYRIIPERSQISHYIQTLSHSYTSALFYPLKLVSKITQTKIIWEILFNWTFWTHCTLLDLYFLHDSNQKYWCAHCHMAGSSQPQHFFCWWMYSCWFCNSSHLLSCNRNFMKIFIHIIWVLPHSDIFELKNQFCKYVKNYPKIQ